MSDAPQPQPEPLKLFPQAYSATRAGGLRQKLPALGPAFWGWVAVIALLLVLSVPLWQQAIAPLSAAVEKALAP
jgi:hypothetical protein